MNGFWKRLVLAFQCFFSILLHGDLPNELPQKLGQRTDPVRQAPISAVSPSLSPPSLSHGLDTFDRAVQLLTLLQRDGRLVDFLAENISAYPDAQLGAAVRSIHESCRNVLDHYVKLEPIVNSEEDQPVTLQAGFETAAIKLMGNVAGQPPLRGVLRHKGWRVREVNLPPLPQGAGRMVVAPAEVELS